MRQHEAHERAIAQLKRAHETQLQQEQQAQQRIEARLEACKAEHAEAVAALQHERGRAEQLQEQVEDLQRQLEHGCTAQHALKVRQGPSWLKQAHLSVCAHRKGLGCGSFKVTTSLHRRRQSCREQNCAPVALMFLGTMKLWRLAGGAC